MGDLDGVFVAESGDVEEAMSKSVYFGEVLGKHSSITGHIDPNTVTLLTEDATAVFVIEKYMNGGTGFDPIARYLEDKEYDNG